MGRFFGIFFALSLHGVVLLFGGLLFLRDDEDKGTLAVVDLLTTEEPEKKKDEQKEEQLAQPTEEPQDPEEEPPDVSAMLKELDLSALSAEPELEAASLSAITDALSGISSGSGEFGDALSFASGGRIGGTGKAGELSATTEGMFSMAEIDQKPRAVFQAAPQFPASMRGKKLEGLVTLIFVVDAAGKVLEPRVEESTHPAFDRPALEALRQWKFEPALKNGKRVPWKMRIDIRFPAS